MDGGMSMHRFRLPVTEGHTPHFMLGARVSDW